MERLWSWFPKLLMLLGFVSILAVPFLMRPKEVVLAHVDETLVIVTPHNEAIRSEFTRGFQKWYDAKRGKNVEIDWRTVGGTSEIARYIASEYTNAFENHWVGELNREWSLQVQSAFDNAWIELGESEDDDTEKEAARRSFLESEVGIGIDLFFGGGTYDLIQQAAAGRLVDSGIRERNTEWFTESVIPSTYNGDVFVDEKGRWVGTVLSSFGMIYNKDAYERLGIEKAPEEWRDLADPRLRGQLALADPTMSGSITKAFEMVIQYEILVELRRLIAEGLPAEEAESKAVNSGWLKGMQLLQKISANARYFTDSAQKLPIDVAQGDAAAGMAIDFYGRYQAEAVMRRDNTSRMAYVTPPGGSVYSVDPIAVLRGAPHKELALDFIEYVLSMEGQKLWNYKVGAPSGPTQFALRRLPVRRDFYTEERRQHMSDSTVNPYGPENTFVYHPEWTARLFRVIGFLVRVTCMDTYEELTSAWGSLIEAGEPEEAMAIFEDLSSVSYEKASGEIRTTLRSGNPMDSLELSRTLSDHFRRQYKEAERVARASKTPSKR